MTLTELISEEARDVRHRILGAAFFVGVSNTAIVAFINVIAQRKGGGTTLQDAAVFALLIGVYVFTSRYTCHKISATIEDALHRIKVRILAKIERANLESIERIGTAEIYDRITANLTKISDSATLVSTLLQAVSSIIAAGFYIASLSLPAFIMLVVIFGVGIKFFTIQTEKVATYLRRLAKTRLGFLDQLNDLFKGFKEVKLSQSRGRELREDLQATSGNLRDVTTTSNNILNSNWLFANSNIYVGLAALIFFLPQQVKLDNATVRLLTAAVLFAWGPVINCLAGVPAYLESNVALGNIEVLERKLDDAVLGQVAGEAPEDAWQGRPTSAIEAKNLEYSYAAVDGDEVFHIGPMNLTIAAGETIFLVGGNGSGKSTFLKVLTGLYPPSAGSLRVDGVTVTPRNAAAYRELISSIYSDFHLFSKLYGLPDFPESTVQRLIDQMQLRGKTSFAGDRFTMLALSTGQRKRLAMIVSLLEDRPICIFDEWAADQDPEFRKYFYEELLPSLKQRGKTIIAVSHDDRYFHHADRVVTLEYGLIRSIEPALPAGAAAAEGQGVGLRPV